MYAVCYYISYRSQCYCCLLAFAFYCFLKTAIMQYNAIQDLNPKKGQNYTHSRLKTDRVVFEK